MPKIDKTKVFVRAYSDEDGNNWTQASADITTQYKNAWQGISGNDDDKDDDSPGFELQLLVVSVCIITLGKLIRKKIMRE